jgi:lipopolysaccharide export system protein LptA
MPNIIVSSSVDQFMQSADSAAARSVLGLGDSALKNVGTGAAQVASGNHTHAQLHDAATVSGNGISIDGQQISLDIGTGAAQVASGNHTHAEFDVEFHDAATVSGNGIFITGQQISLDIGTGAAQVASGNHSHSSFVGDTGAGGSAGFVPAPASGDAAAGKYLDADGTWTVPSAKSPYPTSVLNESSNFSITAKADESLVIVSSEVDQTVEILIETTPTTVGASHYWVQHCGGGTAIIKRDTTGDGVEFYESCDDKDYTLENGRVYHIFRLGERSWMVISKD